MGTTTRDSPVALWYSNQPIHQSLRWQLSYPVIDTTKSRFSKTVRPYHSHTDITRALFWLTMYCTLKRLSSKTQSDAQSRHNNWRSADPIPRTQISCLIQGRAGAVLGRLAKALATMIKPLFGAQDDEWVTMVGRYILNMGAIEMATRILIMGITGNDRDPVLSADLPARIGFVRSRFPRTDKARHSWAMNVFEVGLKHVNFRNIVAHSPVLIAGRADGTFEVGGIMNLTPKDDNKVGELVSLAELKGRVSESSAVARSMLEMQSDFRPGENGG